MPSSLVRLTARPLLSLSRSSSGNQKLKHLHRRYFTSEQVQDVKAREPPLDEESALSGDASLNAWYRPYIALERRAGVLSTEQSPLFMTVASETHTVCKHSLETPARPEKLGQDYEAWLRLLRQQELTHGGDGIWRTWICMRRAGVDMPTESEGSVARNLWQLFLTNLDLHELAFNHALELRQKDGSSFPPLFSMVMRHHLDNREEWWFRHFDKAKYVIPTDALQILAISAAMSQSKLQGFHYIYHKLFAKSLPIYDHLIPGLLRKSKYSRALHWHKILEIRNDYPSTAVAKTITIREFQHFRNEIGVTWIPINFKNEAQKHAVEFVESPAKKSEVVAPRLPGTGLFSNFFGALQADGHKEFSDEFCARLFATKALTPSWITAFLEAFSVKKIGPLALRELAKQSLSTSDLRLNMAQLRDAGISFGSSTFARAVERFANEDEDEMLKGLLLSDQHPEVLEDKKLQVQILSQCFRDGDLKSAHRTLTLNTMFLANPDHEYWNQLLRCHVFERRVDGVLQVANEMQIKGIRIDDTSIWLIAKRLLRPRRKGRRPLTLAQSFRFDDLTLVTNLAFRAEKSGTKVFDFLWTELFKRHGMTNFNSMERFCHAIVFAFSTLPSKPIVEMAPDSQRHFKAMLSSLPIGSTANLLHRFFTPLRLKVIVEWGFQGGLGSLNTCIQNTHSKDSRRWPRGLPPPPPAETFLRGLELVQRLAEDGIGVPVDAVRQILKTRLWALFGPGWSNVLRNRAARRVNPYSVPELIRAAEEIWKGPQLFPELAEFLDMRPEDRLHGSFHERSKARMRRNAQLIIKLFGESPKVKGRNSRRMGREDWAGSIAGLAKQHVIRNVVADRSHAMLWKVHT